jgi:anhydromevalonate phosphate decarboxylase
MNRDKKVGDTSFREFLKQTKPRVFPWKKDSNERGEMLVNNQTPFITQPSPHGFSCAGHIFNSRKQIAEFLGMDSLEISIGELSQTPIPPVQSTDSQIPWILRNDLTLADLPFFSIPALPLTNYFTSSIMVVSDNKGDHNLSFHRAQLANKNHLAVRIVQRDLYTLLNQNNGKLKGAFILGCSPGVSLASAFSLDRPGGELGLAGAFSGSPIETFSIDGLLIPTQAELVLTGEFTGQTALEGPFIDLTGTTDPQREQPLFRVDSIFMKPNAIIPMILPSSQEHALLMGLPREAAIYKEIKDLTKSIRGIVLTPGGSGWLHAVISATPKSDPKTIGLSALNAHKSLKRVIIVNEDIDPEDCKSVEWAMATRFQPHKDLTILQNQRGSSLDPSGEDSITSKWICNATFDPQKSPDLYNKLL